MYLACSFICVVFLCLFLFFKVIVFEVSFSQAAKLTSFFLLLSALLSLVQWFVYASYRVSFLLSFCLFVCLFAFPPMGKAE